MRELELGELASGHIPGDRDGPRAAATPERLDGDLDRPPFTVGAEHVALERVPTAVADARADALAKRVSLLGHEQVVDRGHAGELVAAPPGDVGERIVPVDRPLPLVDDDHFAEIALRVQEGLIEIRQLEPQTLELTEDRREQQSGQQEDRDVERDALQLDLVPECLLAEDRETHV